MVWSDVSCQGGQDHETLEECWLFLAWDAQTMEFLNYFQTILVWEPSPWKMQATTAFRTPICRTVSIISMVCFQAIELSPQEKHILEQSALRTTSPLSRKPMCLTIMCLFFCFLLLGTCLFFGDDALRLLEQFYVVDAPACILVAFALI